MTTYDYIVIIITFLLSVLLTMGGMKIFASTGIMDYPNARSSHRIAVPRAGGIALVFVFIVAMLLYIQGLDQSLEQSLGVICIAGLSVAMVGLYDDMRHLNPFIRFILYALSVIVSLYFLGVPQIQVGDIVFEAGLGNYILGFVILLWVLNLFNFMDGTDAIASFEAISISAGGALILSFFVPDHYLIMPLFFITAVTAGFLVWNYPPARIFMGDVASGFLGLTLALLGMLTCIDESMNVWAWFILFGVFFVDATVTILRRMYSRHQLHIAHCDHAYQRAVLILQGREYSEAKRSRSHRCVSLTVLAINVLWLIPLAFIATAYPQWGIWLTLLALAPLVGLSVWLGAGSGKDIEYT